ncbi:MAG TPA: SnoaL-like domain-containing protein [Steroidobacteraceae bacterium]
MSTQTIATRLTELCRQGEWETAQKELFAQDAISIEPENSGDLPKETKGLNAIIEKGHKWQSLVQEVHGITTSSPLVSGNTIALKLAMDVTMKGRGRQKMEEICVYEVKNDKIVSEQFFM